MFARLRRARHDHDVLKTLLPRAEALAEAEGTEPPGAEHLLLAALDLDDGSARAALAEQGVDADRLASAVSEQHDRALAQLRLSGQVGAAPDPSPPVGPATGPFRARPSLHALFRRTTELVKEDGRPLASGHVLLAATEVEHGTLARTFELLSLDRARLARSVRRHLDGRTDG